MTKANICMIKICLFFFLFSMFPLPDPNSEILYKMKWYFVDMNHFKIYLPEE